MTFAENMKEDDGLRPSQKIIQCIENARKLLYDPKFILGHDTDLKFEEIEKKLVSQYKEIKYDTHNRKKKIKYTKPKSFHFAKIKYRQANAVQSEGIVFRNFS